MAKLLNCIVETRILESEVGQVNKTLNHKDIVITKANNYNIVITRVNNLLFALNPTKENRGYSINDNLIAVVVNVDKMWDEKNQCVIPCFGHDYMCECTNHEPFGVMRIYGLGIVVDGYPTFEQVSGVYELDENTRIDVCECTENELKLYPAKLKKIVNDVDKEVLISFP